MEFVDVKNVTYACKIHQRDETLPWLLMLHGFMGDHRAFDHLIDKLCKFCNPFTVDLLGHGASSKPSDPSRYKEDNQIEDIITLIQTKIPAPLFLHGYSMGGRLALQIASRYPQLFEGVILESTNGGISDPQKRKERQKTDAVRAESITNNFKAFLSDWKNIDLFTSPIPSNKSLTQKYHQIQSEQLPAALAASLKGFGTGIMTPVCDKLTQRDLPVLLVAGSADEKYQQINSNLAEQFPNATFSSIEAGHRMHLDNPDDFLREIKSFIKKRHN